MNWFAILINAISPVIFTVLIAGCFVVSMLHFFKKETILNRIKLNTFDTAFFSVVIGFLAIFGLLMTSIQSDTDALGVSAGSWLLISCIAFIIVIEGFAKLFEWRRNLPKT